MSAPIDDAHRRAFCHYTQAEYLALPFEARLEARAQRNRDWIAGLIPSPEFPWERAHMTGNAAVSTAYVEGLNRVEQSRVRTLNAIASLFEPKPESGEAA